MDTYRKGLLFTLCLSIVSCSLAIYLFLLPREEKRAVLGTYNNSSVLSEHGWAETELNSKEVLYNNELLEIKHEDNSLLILPKNLKLFQYGVIAEVDSGENIEDIIKNKKTYPEINLIHSVDELNYSVLLFSFNQPYLFNNDETREVYLTVYLTKNELGENYYIEVRGFNYLTDKKSNDSFLEILDSLISKSNTESLDTVLGTTTSQNSLGRVLGQASTVKIFSRNCYDLSFTNEFDASFAGKTYEVCAAGIGSGFIINSTAEILTNAHVAKPNQFDTIINGVSTDGQYELDMGTDLIDILYAFLGDLATFLSEQELQTFYIYVFSEMYKEGYAKISNGTTELYVQGSENFDIDIEKQVLNNKSMHYSSKLVKSNDISSLYETVLSTVDQEQFFEEDFEDVVESTSVQEGLTGTADIALLRLDSINSIPSLPISEEDPNQGENIYVIGYPGVNEDGMLTSSDSQVAATVTQGSITGIKPNTTNTYNLLQIDASIEAGNSGGPIVDEAGKALGITTYSYASSSGNFNWGISSTELNSFLTQSGSASKSNEANLLLTSALTDISKDYFSRSKDKLETLVSNENTLASVLNPLITLCDTSISQGNDKSPWLELDFIDIPNWGILLIGGIFLVMIIVIIILLVVSKKNKGDDFPKPSYDTETPPSPTPAPSPQVQEAQQVQQPTPSEEKGYLRPQNQSIQSIRSGNVQPNVAQQDGINTQPVSTQSSTQPNNL